MTELKFNSNDFQVIKHGNLVAKRNKEVTSGFLAIRPRLINILSLKTNVMKTAMYHKEENVDYLYRDLEKKFGWKADIDIEDIKSAFVYRYKHSSGNMRHVIFFAE